MQIRNLLRIIFRIFGLYTVISLAFTFLPQQIVYLLNAQMIFPFDSQNGVLQDIIYLIIILFFIVLSAYLLIINPDVIINKLKPLTFLDERIDFQKLNAESLLQIAILSVGILILFDSVPELINKSFLLLKLKKMGADIGDELSTVGLNYEIMTASFKTLIGLIFIVFQNKIGKMLFK
jgi:hypothetical protein